MSRPLRHPTLDDVAKQAGVSTATVSRCLNTPDQVSTKTRAKVTEAVNLLGYTPHFGARVLAAKRTQTIGAIIPTMENAIFAEGLQAFQESLHEKGYTLLVSSTAYRPELEAEQIRTLIARGADGLLLIGYERDATIYDYLRARGLPFVLAWAHRADSPHTAIGFDNLAAMAELTSEVLRQGHRRIAVISGICAGNDRATDRVAGVRQALRMAGLDTDGFAMVEAAYTFAAGAAAFGTLMDTPTPPTVVICANDVLAVGAMQRARDMGLAVPGDVSITGFDDNAVSTLVTPRLTTVHVPHREMGTMAAQELIGQIAEKRSGSSHRLESGLRLRETLAPPRII